MSFILYFSSVLSTVSDSRGRKSTLIGRYIVVDIRSLVDADD